MPGRVRPRELFAGLGLLSVEDIPRETPLRDRCHLDFFSKVAACREGRAGPERGSGFGRQLERTFWV